MPSPSPATKPVYLDVNHAMAQVGDAQVLQGMLCVLEETLTRDIPLIAALLEAGDTPGANRLLHPLKGIIPIFCGPALSGQVVRVELLSKDAGSTAVGPAYAQLMPELTRLLADVSVYLQASRAM